MAFLFTFNIYGMINRYSEFLKSKSLNEDFKDLKTYIIFPTENSNETHTKKFKSDKKCEEWIADNLDPTYTWQYDIKEQAETVFKSIDDIIDNKEYCPFDVSIIPNNMGINLSAVDKISWQKMADDQLTNISIYFKTPENIKESIIVSIDKNRK